jgi:hypothetical protein
MFRSSLSFHYVNKSEAPSRLNKDGDQHHAGGGGWSKKFPHTVPGISDDFAMKDDKTLVTSSESGKSTRP